MLPSRTSAVNLEIVHETCLNRRPCDAYQLEYGYKAPDHNGDIGTRRSPGSMPVGGPDAAALKGDGIRRYELVSPKLLHMLFAFLLNGTLIVASKPKMHLADAQAYLLTTCRLFGPLQASLWRSCLENSNSMNI